MGRRRRQTSHALAGIIVPRVGDFVVIERRAPQVDCELATLARPVRLQLTG